MSASKDIPVLLIVATFVLQVFLFTPLQVLMQNFGEFSVRFTDILIIFLASAVGLFAFLYLLVRVLRARVLLAALAYLSTVALLESSFLFTLAQHHPFDGKPIDWPALQWLSLVELAAFAILAIVFSIYRRRTQVFSYLSLFILMFVGSGFFYKTVIHLEMLLPDPQATRTGDTYHNQFYRLSRQRNVIHIVPDQTQGAMLQDIMSSDDARYSEVFDGFTLFTQATGLYKGTYPNVVFYMAGEAPQPDQDLVLNQPFTRAYIEEVLSERSIVPVLSRNGFKTFGFQFHPGIFCKGPFTACTGTHDEVFGGAALNSPQRRTVLAALTAMDLALFQMTPIFLRERIHDDGRWFAKKLASGVFTHSGVLDYFTDRMETDQSPGSYNYIHHAGAHAPLLFDRDCRYIGPQPIEWQNQREQVMCTLAQLEDMITRLKKLDVYDQTMIVIHGDHGTPWLPPSLPSRSGEVISEELMGMASTLILIKPPQARGPLRFSDRPVTIGDIPATIANALGIDHVFPGVQMFNAEPIADRERYYYTYDSSSRVHSLEALPNLRRYRIRGDVFDQHDWVVPNAANSGKHPSQLRMDHAGFERYARGFSFLEDHGLPVRWVDGIHAWVSLSPPPRGPMALVFESFVPPSIDGQWMEVSVGGRFIARLDEKQLKDKRHTLTLPDDLPRTQMLEIEFTLGKTMSPNKDPRRLSVLFSFIGLVPGG